MNTSPASPRVLYLVTKELSSARLEELRQSVAKAAEGTAEIITLTELNAAQALQKIFLADTVTFWGELMEPKTD